MITCRNLSEGECIRQNTDKNCFWKVESQKYRDEINNFRNLNIY